jgi:hypothetical protein
MIDCVRNGIVHQYTRFLFSRSYRDTNEGLTILSAQEYSIAHAVYSLGVGMLGILQWESLIMWDSPLCLRHL